MTFRLLLSSLFPLFLVLNTMAQERGQYDYERRFRVYTVDGQTFMVGELDSVTQTAPTPTARELRRGRRALRNYSRLRFNVHKVYPYAEKIAVILDEVEKEISALPNERARREYVKQREKSLFGDYEDDVRTMTRSQGKVLVRLIHRQTKMSTFELIQDNKNGASALFWQSISLIFGINLRTEFDPSNQEEDSMIEYIVRDLEAGGYNIAYGEYNYHLQ